MIILTGSVDSYAQLITVLVIFIVVLAITAWTTRFIASYQKQMGAGSNVEVVEATRIDSGKCIQIVRIGERYFAIAVCKDTVSTIGEIPKEEIVFRQTAGKTFDFKALLNSAMHKETKE